MSENTFQSSRNIYPTDPSIVFPAFATLKPKSQLPVPSLIPLPLAVILLLYGTYSASECLFNLYV